jgi:glycosyltransferase involved in cell wall biosynthesis
VTRGTSFPGRVGIQQRVLPAYRAFFIDGLAARCTGGVSVFAGEPRKDEMIAPAPPLRNATRIEARNLHLLTGSTYLCFQRGLLRWLEAADPDVLVLEANWRYPASQRAITWMHARGRPVLGWGLGAPPGAASSLRRQFLRRLDGVLAYSTRGAAEYAGAGIPVDRIYVAPNAVDEPPARPPARRAGRRPTRAIFVGRLQPRKGVDRLLLACRSVSPAPELVIVGEGPDKQRLQSLAVRDFPAARFAGGAFGGNLRRLLDRADLFVLPGTGGLAVQQAMARGLPVIAAEGDGSQEDMVTPLNGWLVPAGDVEALTVALQTAVAEPKRLRVMGQASHRLAVERFRPSIMTDVFVRALRETAGA